MGQVLMFKPHQRKCSSSEILSRKTLKAPADDHSHSSRTGSACLHSGSRSLRTVHLASPGGHDGEAAPTVREGTDPDKTPKHAPQGDEWNPEPTKLQPQTAHSMLGPQSTTPARHVGIPNA